MRKKTAVMLACAAAGAISGLGSSVNAQQTFSDNFNNGSFANSDTIPNFFSSEVYQAADGAFITEPVGGPLTMGMTMPPGTQGGPSMYGPISNEFNVTTGAVSLTLTAAPGGNLMPNFDSLTSQSAETFISLGGTQGRADNGAWRFTLGVSNDNIPQIVVRDGTDSGIYHYSVFPSNASYMPEENPGSGATNPVSPGFDVTQMFIYVDGSQAAAGHWFLNFGETWLDTRTTPYTYGTYTFDERLNITSPFDLGTNATFAGEISSFTSAFAGGSSPIMEVLNGGTNFNAGEAVPMGQLTDLTTYTWNNNNASGSGDGATWDAGTNSNWVNMETAATPANPTSTYTDGSGSAVQFNDTNSGHYSVTLNTTVHPGSVLVSNDYGNYTISGTGKIVDAGAFTKSGGDNLTLGVGLTTANLTITGGGFSNYSTSSTALTGSLMTLAPGVAGGKGPSATSAITVGALNIDGTSQLDITNNHMIVNYGTGTDPISSIAAMITSGYNAGKWNGPGIISSTAATNNATPGNLLYGIGYADSADPGNPAGLSSGTIEIAYTLLGDANLSGVVDGTDFGILAANFNKGVTGWDRGDFNYNNVVDGTDFGLMAANFNKGVSGGAVGLPAYDDPAILAFAAANGLLADVPEPATVGLLLMASAGMLARRRRN